MTYRSSQICHLALVAGLACLGSSQARGADVTNEVQKWCGLYDMTWNTKGPVVVANTFFADDVVFIPPNGAVIRGKEAVAKLWGDFYKEPTVHKCTVQESHSEGQGAWSFGETTITGTPASHVRWLNFVVQQDGQWKVKMLGVIGIPDK